MRNMRNMRNMKKLLGHIPLNCFPLFLDRTYVSTLIYLQLIKMSFVVVII